MHQISPPGDYDILPVLLAGLTPAAKMAAIAGAKAICSATGGMDYAMDYGFTEWAKKHLRTVGSFAKELAIKGGKAFCKSI